MRAYKLEGIRRAVPDAWTRSEQDSAVGVDFWETFTEDAWLSARLHYTPEGEGEPAYALEAEVWGFCRQLGIDAKRFTRQLDDQGEQYLGPFRF